MEQFSVTRWKVLAISSLAICGVFLISGRAQADLRFDPPKKEKAPTSYRLEVQVGDENRVVIPGNAVRSSSIFSQSSTVIAGLAISLAFVSLVFVVRSKRRSPAAVALVLSVALFGATQMVVADVVVEPRKTDEVKLINGGRGNTVTIVLTKSMVDKLVRQARRGEGDQDIEKSSPPRD